MPVTAGKLKCDVPKPGMLSEMHTQHKQLWRFYLHRDCVQSGAKALLLSILLPSSQVVFYEVCRGIYPWPIGLLIVWREAHIVITLGPKHQSCGNNCMMRQLHDQHTADRGWLHLRRLIGAAQQMFTLCHHQPWPVAGLGACCLCPMAAAAWLPLGLGSALLPTQHQE